MWTPALGRLEVEMKKLFSIIFFLTISLGYHCFAQNFDLKYYSSIQDGDYTSNYKVYSYAEYIGIASEINEDKIEEFKNNLPDSVRVVQKMTKNNLWLIKKAINEWDYKIDEYYIVACADSPYADTGIFLFVKILAKDKFDWWGFVITEETMDEISSLFEEKE